MFGRLHCAPEVFRFQLGMALKMEEYDAVLLRESVGRAQDQRVVAVFSEHLASASSQHENLGVVFASLGWPLADSPCHAMHGIQKDAASMAKMTDDPLVDGVLLAGVALGESYEIAVYRQLIQHAQAIGAGEVADALVATLDQEREMLKRVQGLHRTLSDVGAAHVPG